MQEQNISNEKVAQLLCCGGIKTRMLPEITLSFRTLWGRCLAEAFWDGVSCDEKQ